jgi:stage V sporulation protein G
VEITEVRIKLMEDPSERLQAFCSITFDDCFVIRDLKIIEGTNGPFVAMPSRKLTAHCPQCGCKNHLRAAYCNQCGTRLKDDRAARDEEGRAKLYADIAHPINSSCRELIQKKVIEAFQQELEESKLPGYVSRYDDFDQEDSLVEAEEPAPRRAPPRREPARPREEMPPAAPVPMHQSRVQPPQRPSGPHKAPLHQSTPPAKGEFGAGIL